MTAANSIALIIISAINGWQLMLTPLKNPQGAYGWSKCTQFELVKKAVTFESELDKAIKMCREGK